VFTALHISEKMVVDRTRGFWLPIVQIATKNSPEDNQTCALHKYSTMHYKGHVLHEVVVIDEFSSSMSWTCHLELDHYFFKISWQNWLIIELACGWRRCVCVRTLPVLV
jgi:hypothetical protein